VDSGAAVVDSEAVAPREDGELRPSKLIDAAGSERITRAVHAAEANTSGEIVVSVVGRSDEHAAAPWRLSFLLAALSYFAASFAPIDLTGPALFGVQLLAVLVGHALGRVPGIRRLFIPESERTRTAERAAVHEFHEQGMQQTEGRTGILIYVTLLEHRVVVLADEAIDRVLDPDESWEDVVELVLEGIRSGDITSGIESAIARCGEILSHPLPIQPDDRDEIPHALVLRD